MDDTTHHASHILLEAEDVLKSTEIDTAFNVLPPPGSSGVKLSREVVQFLMDRKESPHEVLTRPIVQPPGLDDSLPLTHYFISTSHNTYLLSYQLMGRTDATAYTRVLSHTCRCVEIDVWPSSDGPIVTHGWTWSDHIPFRDVCRAIGKAVHPNDWPVMVSLECHVDTHEQDRIAHTMRKVWGEKLVEKEIAGLRKDEITPGQLRGKILLMVEYYPPTSPTDTNGSFLDNNLGHSEDRVVQKELRISSSLASLGVYGRSVKPGTGWLAHGGESSPSKSRAITYTFQPAEVPSDPRHIVYNLSEVALDGLLPGSREQLTTHSLRHLRRVYPKATRITSANLVPLEHWRSGTQISALNWQRYDRGLQFNEAMFVGSGGWVCKPDRLRGITPLDDRRPVRLTLELVGGCNIPKPSHDIKAYVYVELFLPSGEQTWQSQARHQSSALPTTSPSADVLWNEKCHWDFLEDDIAFLRLGVYRKEWGKDDRLGTFCARVDYLQQGWRFVRLFDKRGKHNGGLLLVRFTYV